jgi:hypothetical protein
MLFAQGEYLVNTYQDTSQRDPRIVRDDAGSYTIVWCSVNQADADSDSDIYMQRFDVDDNKLGGEILINDVTANSQERPSVAMNSAGDMVAVWASHSGDNDSIFDIKAKLYKNNAPVGTEFLVNTTTLHSQTKPAVAMHSSGAFVIVWESWYQDGSSKGVYMQRFNSSGEKAGVETLVNTTTVKSQSRPIVEYFEDGKFIIIWESWEQVEPGGGYDLFGKVFDADGNSIKEEFTVNTYTDSYQWFADIVTLQSGEFITVWCSWDQDGHWGGIYLQKFDSEFEKSGEEIPVNTTTVNYQWLPKIKSMPDSNIAVVWSSWKQDGSREGVYAQTFDYDLNKISFESKVNEYTDSYQWEADFIVTDNNELLVVWSSWNQYDDYDVIASKIIPESPQAVIDDDTFKHALGNSTSRIFVHVMDSTKLTGDQYKVTFDIASESNAYATITNVTASETPVGNFSIGNGEGVFYLTEEFDGIAVQIVPVYDFKLDMDRSYFINNSGSNLSFTIGQGLGSSKLAPIDFIVVWGDTDTLADGSYANPLDSAYNQTGQKVVMSPFYAWNLTDREKMDLVIIEPNATTNLRWDASESIGFLTPPQYETNWPQYHASLIPSHSGGEPMLPEAGDTNYILTQRPLTSEDEFTFITNAAFLTTGIIEDQLPYEFDLKQNYPNPFNPTTTIEFTIPVNSSPRRSEAKTGKQYAEYGLQITEVRKQKSENRFHNQSSNQQFNQSGRSGLQSVKLVVYNILGQEVKTLVNKELAPGQYRVQFNASGLASGIYFYNIQMENKSISRKMIFLK